MIISVGWIGMGTNNSGLVWFHRMHHVTVVCDRVYHLGM